MIETGEGFDWATAEALAFGSLADRGLPRAPVRAGQHARHLLAAPFGLIDQETENATTR
jgi:2-oxoglutarate dehydrogenase complex dehydrogenase (E1) component-like enzyme